MTQFQDKTLTWAEGLGFVRRGKDYFQLNEKPDLTFPFEAVYAEETNSFKTVDGKHRPLAEEDIVEILAWIDARPASHFQRVLGVDEKGSYIGECLPSEAFKVVRSGPPTNDNWLYDFEQSAAVKGDAWREVFAVDAEGRYQGRTLNFAELADSEPPRDDTKDWRWRNGAWVDETLPSTAKHYKLGALKLIRDAKLANGEVNVDLGGTHFKFGTDDFTRSEVLSIALMVNIRPELVPNPRPFTPKGSADAFGFSHAAFETIVTAITLERDRIIGKYNEHKVAITALATTAEVYAYDFSKAWDG